MAQAIALAKQAQRLSPPNPCVGAVVVSASGEVLGRGFTQRTGGPHAEVMALKDAADHGRDVRGASIYVTLEPCSHHGRTPPCCNALVAAGIARVIASLPDPNPLVAGRGFERLRAAGIEVEVGPGAAESRELNIGFFSRMVRKLPWVRLKVASSLDGTTALADGSSQWITSPAAREDGHGWRARAGALLTGIGTVLADDPRLDVRLPDTPRQPPLAVVDSRLDTPVAAKLFAASRPVWIYTASDDPARRAALVDRGAEVILLPDARGKVDLAAMLRDLAAREVNELHVEAGFKLNGSLVRAGLVDEFLVYLAPKLLGPGMGMANLDALASLDQATALDFVSAESVGPDLRILARIPGRDSF
jgi:diaminohydroxyphosphoribosylaminopyrimidine deaminase/5-amino-6-(5-phosphoribosylamino)uracil reductase